MGEQMILLRHKMQRLVAPAASIQIHFPSYSVKNLFVPAAVREGRAQITGMWH